MRLRTKNVLCFVIVLSIIICGLGVQANDAKQWIEDIDYLAKQLPREHKNLFANLKKTVFEQEIEELKQEIPNLSENEIVANISRIVAMVGDAHTTLGLNVTRAYPLSFYWFEEGIYLAYATAEYKEALYCKLTKINGHKLEEVMDILCTVISHENEAQLKSKIPQYLIFTDMLLGLGLISNPYMVEYTFMDRMGEEFSLIVEPISATGGRPELIGGMEATPLYCESPEQYYWYRYLEDAKTVYFKYNACSNMQDQSVSSFTKELLSFVDKNPVEKLVIDLRNNGGGNSALLDSFINKLKKNKKLNQEGKLFVIIGRETFSSAILNAASLKNKTTAIFVGEPTGGRPNHYGEVKYFRLPNSQMYVTYSTKYFTYFKEDVPTFVPDIAVELSIDDYIHGKDPVLETILTEF